VTQDVLEDAASAAVDMLVAEGGGPAWDEAGFARLREHVAGSLADRTAAIVGDAVKVLDAAREVERLLDGLTAVPLQPARADVREQVRRLIFPGWVSATGAARLPDVERYLRAAARRLERLPNAVAVDRDRMNAIHELERAYRERLRSAPSAAVVRDVPWMLEELRVNQFAQNLARGGVSAKRIRRALTETAAGP
jgi:ATP-dependent helicase HrpA